MTTISERVHQEFCSRFGASPEAVVCAPGRVNLIGEHTDYNDGFVLPIAIDRAVWIALRRRKDRVVVVHSLDFGETARVDLTNVRHEDDGWVEYIRGVVWGMQEAGFELSGWDGLIGGDVPVGAGLSSSAAVELAAARAFAVAGHLDWDAKAMALLAQRVENEWVGVQCGIMDQMIVATALEDRAMLIDCRTLELTPAPLPSGTTVVILDTGTRRGLVDSAYNERRRSCEEAARHAGVAALRDLTEDTLAERLHGQPPEIIRRARHVVTENARTLAAVEAMDRDDPVRLGELMNASHTSLRDDFEVSSPELDLIVDFSQQQAGCFGARMTGAGFGGCAVALVRSSDVASFTTVVAVEYGRRTGITPRLYACRASRGAHIAHNSMQTTEMSRTAL